MVASFSDWRSCFWACAQLLDRALLPLEELGVLDGEGGVAGEGLGGLQAVRAEGGGGLLVVHVDARPARGRRAPPASARGERRGMQTIVRRSMRMTLCAPAQRRVGHRVAGGHRLPGLAAPCARPTGEALHRRGGSARAPRGAPRARAGRPTAAYGARRPAELLGQEQEAALGPRDPHDGVEHLLEDLAQDQGGVEGLHQGEQELLLLDPGELGDLLRGARPAPSGENFRVTLPSWICAP